MFYVLCIAVSVLRDFVALSELADILSTRLTLLHLMFRTVGKYWFKTSAESLRNLLS